MTIVDAKKNVHWRKYTLSPPKKMFSGKLDIDVYWVENTCLPYCIKTQMRNRSKPSTYDPKLLYF